MSLSKTQHLVLVGVLVGFGYSAGRTFGPSGGPAPESSSSVEVVTAKVPEVWTCSMHPQVRLPEAGKCPICFMDLIPGNTGADDEDLGPRTLRMSETARALAEIETAKVERRAVAHEVNMVGKVTFDETRVAYITSWVSGRLDRLFVDYTGVSVREGDHLVEIYSPTLYSAQEELLQAIGTSKKLEGSSLDIVRTTSDQTVHSAREKLRLYGLSDQQIQEVVDTGVANEHITVRAPFGGVVVHKDAREGMYVKEGTKVYTIADLSKVWVQLNAYESDLAWIRYGQDIEFRLEAYPGETFHGRVAFIDPTLDDRTRTVSVRLNVDNPNQRLKPEMFVSATAHAVLTKHGKVVDEDLAGKWMCPMHPEIVTEGPDACPECGMDLVPASELGFTASAEDGRSLVIPHTAPLITGRRAVVYVRVPDQEKPTYEGREIALGPRAGDWYVVYEGIEEGEDIVVKGNFKIDSELQIRAKPSMMSGDGTAPPAGPPEATAVSTPQAFREQLGQVLTAYLDLQGALANDTDNSGAAQQILKGIVAVDMTLLEGEAHMSWMQQQGDLERSAQELAAAPDLAGRRVLLSPFTDRLVYALKTFGHETSAGNPGVFHCPMALDGAGADWIQLGEETANPYYGASMLRCGDLQDSLPGGSLVGMEMPAGGEPMEHAAMPMNSGGAMATPAEFSRQLDVVVDAYLALQTAFANDVDDPGSAQAIVDRLAGVNMGLLAGEAHMAWMKHLPTLRSSAQALAKAGDLESRRLLLSPLTETLLASLKELGYGHKGMDIGVFHCPMALDFEGANWLQVGDETSNPYFGDSMLRCGSRKELLQGEN